MKRLALLVVVIALGAYAFTVGCSGRCENCERVVHLTVLRGVNFDFDKYQIRPEGYQILEEDIKILQNDPKLKVRIEGHCDIRGSDAYNKKLSVKRAKAVYDYFVSKGISKERMVVVGYGRSRPLVPNTSEENMFKNRRVEVKIVERIK
ncbi:MAG: OmpA family protein [Pseudomonadota bacterium]